MALTMKEQQRVTVIQRVVHRRPVELARKKYRSFDTDNGRHNYQSQSAIRAIFETKKDLGPSPERESHPSGRAPRLAGDAAPDCSSKVILSGVNGHVIMLGYQYHTRPDTTKDQRRVSVIDARGVLTSGVMVSFENEPVNFRLAGVDWTSQLALGNKRR